MDYIFDEWKKLLENFQASVTKDLSEIRKQKAEIQQMKIDIFDRLDKGLYYRDEERIVISAPEIVIGNVDKSGDLQGSTGRIVLRGSEIALDGVGEMGTIVSRAPIIRQTAVDPGTDGREDVVWPHSLITTQARDIVLQSNDATDAFSLPATSVAGSGIRIHADHNLQIEAAVTADSRKKQIEDTTKSLDADIKTLQTAMNTLKAAIDKRYHELSSLMDKGAKMNNPDDTSLARTNLIDINAVNEETQDKLAALYRSTQDYINTVSALAEMNRKKKALDTEKGTVKTGDDFKSKTTQASLAIVAESMRVATTDGEGNLHTNPEAGINIRTPRMAVTMTDDKGVLAENSYLNVNTRDIALSTLNPAADGKSFTAQGSVRVMSQDIRMESVDYELKSDKYTEKGQAAQGKVSIVAKTVEVDTTNPSGIERDAKGKVTKGEYKSEGDVVVRAKNISMETLDYEVNDGKLSPKTLTQGSHIQMRTEQAAILAADTEGKATGSISLNAKAVSVKSMDVDKEKLEDKSLAPGSSMLLLSEKMYIGAKDNSNKSKKVQAVSEEVGLFADKTLEAQQDNGKAALQLSGGNAAVAGSKTQVYGDTTINGKTEIKGDVKAPKATIDNLEAKSSFKSTNISDGIAVPGSPGGGSLSTKLKVEEIKAKS